MAQMLAATQKSYMLNGVPTSIADLGFTDIGLDDNWQNCSSRGTEGYTYHDPVTGAPIVRLDTFPNMKTMTDYAHSLGLTAGWYGNNCICKDHCATGDCYSADAAATVAYGFDSTKLDGCGAELDLQQWWDLFAASGKDIMVENCHWGGTLPNATWCPWTYYRSSGDINPSFNSIIGNLHTVFPLATKNLSTPQCWAYPDMSEIGASQLSYAEWNTHWTAWAIVSSPQIIGFDMTDTALVKSVWPIMSNNETMEVSQTYYGFSGSMYDSAVQKVDLCSEEQRVAGVPCTTASVWEALYKPIDARRTAVLVINLSGAAADLTVTFSAVPNLPCASAGTCNVRDINAKANLGAFKGTYTAKGVASHDSVFVMLST